MKFFETVFDTTHVLTQGIVERRIIEEHDDDWIDVEAPGCLNNRKSLPPDKWEVNLKPAIMMAEAEKERKIRNLQKQIKKLEETPIKIVRLERDA